MPESPFQTKPSAVGTEPPVGGPPEGNAKLAAALAATWHHRPALTAVEVAALLAVPEDTVRNLHRVGRLPGFRIGKHLRWSPAAVRRFVEAAERCE